MLPKIHSDKLNILSTVVLEILHHDLYLVLNCINIHKDKLGWMAGELARNCIMFWALKGASDLNLKLLKDSHMTTFPVFLT